MEDRIIELEKKVSFQENMIEELNSVVCTQHAAIDALTIQVMRLEERMKSGSLVKDITDEEPPPHY